MDKPKEILELEWVYGIELRKVSEEYFSRRARNSYVLNPNEKITHLDLCANRISEIKGLGMLGYLETLNLCNNKISEIKGLETLEYLKRLDLSSNKISEIKGLERLGNLQELYLSGNQISDIKGLETLGKLQELDLSNNQISEIKGLETLGKLQSLLLFFNQISKIKGLGKLGNLQKLYLSFNKISKIKGLETLGKLQSLDLSDNQINNIKALETLENLQKLYLSNNQISKIKGLKFIIKREKLTNIRIDNNPFLQDISLSLKKNENHKDALLEYFSDLKPKGGTIFLSYCFKDKAIVDKIDEKLRSFGLSVKRDERDLNYKSNVKKFMSSLKEADFVIPIISDSYLRSTNCMFEIGELLKVDNYKSKTLQIILPDAKIFNRIEKYDYFKYWEEQYSLLQAKTKDNLSAANIKTIDNDLKHYKDIIDSLSPFIEFVTSEKGLSLSELELSEYRDLLKKLGIASAEL